MKFTTSNALKITATASILSLGIAFASPVNIQTQNSSSPAALSKKYNSPNYGVNYMPENLKMMLRPTVAQDPQSFSGLIGGVLTHLHDGAGLITDWSNFCNHAGKFCVGQLTPDLQSLSPILQQSPMVNNQPNYKMFNQVSQYVKSGGSIGLDSARVALLAVAYITP